MIILPTIYRPESLKRFVQAYVQTDASLPVWVVMDENNFGFYHGIELPPTFRRVRVTPGTRIGDIFNIILKHHPNEDFYGIMADDVVPTTFRWDIMLREACLPNKIAWGLDGGHDETLPRHPFIGGALVRNLGFLAVPGLKHWFVDNAWRDIAQALECGEYRPEIRMTHLHYTSGQSAQDRTYSQQPDPRADEIMYNVWKERELPLLIERIRKQT